MTGRIVYMYHVHTCVDLALFDKIDIHLVLSLNKIDIHLTLSLNKIDIHLVLSLNKINFYLALFDRIQPVDLTQAPRVQARQLLHKKPHELLVAKAPVQTKQCMYMYVSQFYVYL